MATEELVAIYHIADDKIVEEWSTLDTLGLLKQLGAIPVIGQGKDSPCNARPSVEL